MSCVDCRHLEDGRCNKIMIRADGRMFLRWFRLLSGAVYLKPQRDFHCRFFKETLAEIDESEENAELCKRVIKLEWEQNHLREDIIRLFEAHQKGDCCD